MYVIIDDHSVGWIPENWFPPNTGNETTVEKWTEFWRQISSRYAHNNVVAFYELFNEPALISHWPYTKADWLTWKGLVEPLINNTIRPNDPDKIILVGGLQSAFDLSFVASAPIADISHNVAYATHPYAGAYIDPFNTPSLTNWDRAFGTLSEQFPVFATEIGYKKDFIDPCCRDPEIGGVPYHEAIVDYREAHHISWIVWIFSSDWGTVLLTNNDTFEPSEAGIYFRRRLLELNNPP